ncbi:MAG TPA: isoprenyl transferase [Chloroflexi bacterium]|nr:isoprenyl transferase [Chloroflexota bacterium]
MSSEPQERSKTYPPLEHVPVHIGIIMDGNGRWAQARGLPRLSGHRAGAENLRHVLRATAEFGIRILTIYAFSTENWGRPEDEVRGLMDLMAQMIDRELDKLHQEGVQIRHIGRLERVPDYLKERIRHALELTKDNRRLILNVAFNYGGRAEIVDAIRRIIQDGVPAEAVDESLIARYLYTAGLPDPDLIIRTSGELRVSNFLIWQGAYTEYYVTPIYWPDFDKDELYKALVTFSQRERRFGLLSG